jgi:hypothetical protein
MLAYAGVCWRMLAYADVCCLPYTRSVRSWRNFLDPRKRARKTVKEAMLLEEAQEEEELEAEAAGAKSCLEEARLEVAI